MKKIARGAAQSWVLAIDFTMVYSGSLDGWYLTEKMADFFAGFLQAQA